MGARTLTIEHNGVTYSGEIATITSTFFGTEHHGILSASLNLKFDGSGISVGGYCLDSVHKDEAGRFVGRVGSAYGLDHLMRIMETVGVDNWEQLQGRQMIALFEGNGGWGASAVGIAGLTNDKVLVFKEHANEWREREAA